MTDTASPSPEWVLLKMRGADAADFLQRLSTADVKRMAPGSGAPACFLDPRGGVIAYFHLRRISPDEFAIEVDPGPAETHLQRWKAFVERYTFAERFTVETAAAPERQAWTWAMPGAGLTETGRIEAMIPRAGYEITESANPFELGLQSAMAPNKGCYPGQEVLEKIAAFGAPAKRLVLLEGPGEAPPSGTNVRGTEADAPAVGRITSSVTLSGSQQGEAARFKALAILRKTHAAVDTGVSIDGKIGITVVRVAEFQGAGSAAGDVRVR